MAINSSAINTNAINSSSAYIPSISTPGPVVTIQQTVGALAIGSVVNIEQKVGYLNTTGPNVTLTQVIEGRWPSVAGPIVNLEQKVSSLGSTVSIPLEQTVVSAADPGSFYSRNGYEPRLYIAGRRIPTVEIHGVITCTFTQDAAPSLTFEIIPPTGLQDVRWYRGKSVVLNIREPSGITRQFTGKVNTPEVKVIEQKIRFNCSLDMEQNVENLMSRSALNQIGLYNNEVFSKPETKLQELQDRISTIPSTLNFRKNGRPAVDVITSGSVFKSLSNVEVRRDDISFKFGDGKRYINRVNLKVDYTYERLHHHERSFQAGTGYGSVCELLSYNYSILMRSMVAGAVQGSDWPLKRGGIAYSDIFEPGWYRCGDIQSNQGWIGWTTLSCSGTTQAVLDDNGDPVTVDGEEQTEIVNASCTDVAPLMCRGAGWISTTRFAQSVKANYTITLNAPQSVSNNGLKERDTTLSITSKYNTEEWEDYNSYTTSIPNGLSVSGTSSTNYWINETSSKAVFNQSLNIMLNKAKSDIIKSHREDKVLFKRGLWTALQMNHTIQLNTDKVKAVGRVLTYSHVMNPQNGEAFTTVELVLSQAGIGAGGVSDSALVLPAPLTSTPDYPTQAVRLGYMYGRDPSQPGAETWTGHIGNRRRHGEFFTTQYPESFVFDTPDIGDSLRNTLDLKSSISYTVDIPDDPLLIDFNEG